MDKRGIMEDTLKTSAVGISGSALTGLGILPDVVSVAVGIKQLLALLGDYLVKSSKNKLDDALWAKVKKVLIK